MSFWLAAFLGAMSVWIITGIYFLIKFLYEEFPVVLIVLSVTGMGALGGVLIAFGAS